MKKVANYTLKISIDKLGFFKLESIITPRKKKTKFEIKVAISNFFLY